MAIRAVFGPNSVMERVAYCESGMSQFDANGNVITSKTADYGTFQINQIHMKEAADMGLDIDTLAGNVLFAKYLYDKNGIRDWLPSRACLDRYYVRHES